MTSETTELPSASLLLVDDTPANLVALEAILSGLNYRLVTATSGPEGLEKLAVEDFALILSDILMPEMDGFQFAKRVRSSPRGHATPIIFLTASTHSDVLATKAYLSGAIEFLVKPLDADVVRAKVAAVVWRHLPKKPFAEQPHPVDTGLST